MPHFDFRLAPPARSYIFFVLRVTSSSSDFSPFISSIVHLPIHFMNANQMHEYIACTGRLALLTILYNTIFMFVTLRVDFVMRDSLLDICQQDG